MTNYLYIATMVVAILYLAFREYESLMFHERESRSIEVKSNSVDRKSAIILVQKPIYVFLNSNHLLTNKKNWQINKLGR